MADANPTCTIPGCDKRLLAKGWCGMHYARNRKRGTTEYEPPFANDEERFFAKVRKTDACWIWIASLDQSGYGVFSVNGHNHRVHRLVVELSGEKIPDGHHVDHICRNRACVRRGHLRVVTPKQNCENRDRAGTGVSGYRGVRWRKSRQCWYVSVTHGGKAYLGGHFRDIEQAAQAASDLRNRLHTHNDADRVATRKRSN